MSGDTYWSNVVFLTGFEGANGSTTAVDESSHAQGTATRDGSAVISTAQKQAGNSSALFTTATHDGFKWPYSTDYKLGTTHFTIECFFNLNTIPSGAYMFLVDRWDVGIWSWALMVNTTGHLGWVITEDGGTLAFDLTDAATVTTGTWYHAAIDYDGVKYRLYKNGTTVATSTTARNIYDPGNGLLEIGASNAAAHWTNGYIDEVRITAGVARYATDTSFTVPSTPFPRSAFIADGIQLTQIGIEQWAEIHTITPCTGFLSQIAVEEWANIPTGGGGGGVTPPPTGPTQPGYLLLVPHYLKGPASGDQYVYYPAGTIVAEGAEIPVGWVPTFAVDPLNAQMAQNFWNAGPFADAEYSRDYYPWIPIQKAVTRWVQVPGKPGQYQLTGLGASLGVKTGG